VIAKQARVSAEQGYGSDRAASWLVTVGVSAIGVLAALVFAVLQSGI
jgi:hypothetical protein